MSFLGEGLELVVTPAILTVAVPRMLHHLKHQATHNIGCGQKLSNLYHDCGGFLHNKMCSLSIIFRMEIGQLEHWHLMMSSVYLYYTMFLSQPYCRVLEFDKLPILSMNSDNTNRITIRWLVIVDMLKENQRYIKPSMKQKKTSVNNSHQKYQMFLNIKKKKTLTEQILDTFSQEKNCILIKTWDRNCGLYSYDHSLTHADCCVRKKCVSSIVNDHSLSFTRCFADI